MWCIAMRVLLLDGLAVFMLGYIVWCFCFVYGFAIYGINPDRTASAYSRYKRGAIRLAFMLLR